MYPSSQHRRFRNKLLKVLCIQHSGFMALPLHKSEVLYLPSRISERKKFNRRSIFRQLSIVKMSQLVSLPLIGFFCDKQHIIPLLHFPKKSSSLHVGVKTKSWHTFLSEEQLYNFNIHHAFCKNTKCSLQSIFVLLHFLLQSNIQKHKHSGIYKTYHTARSIAIVYMGKL